MKKFLALALALAMVLSLAACGGGEDAPPAGGQDPAAIQPAPPEADTPPAPAPESPAEPEPSGGVEPVHELFDLTEKDFHASEELTYASLPVYMTKAIGTLSWAYIDQYSASAGIDLANVTLEDMEILLDYYQSCGGVVVNTPEENQSEHKYEFSFDGTSEMSLRVVYYEDNTIGIACFYLK